LPWHIEPWAALFCFACFHASMFYVAKVVGDALQEPKAKRIKAKGAKDMFKKEFNAERRALGKSCNPANAQWRIDFKEAWDTLPADKMQNLMDRAESNKSEAKAQRSTQVSTDSKTRSRSTNFKSALWPGFTVRKTVRQQPGIPKGLLFEPRLTESSEVQSAPLPLVDQAAVHDDQASSSAICEVCSDGLSAVALKSGYDVCQAGEIPSNTLPQFDQFPLSEQALTDFLNMGKATASEAEFRKKHCKVEEQRESGLPIEVLRLTAQTLT
jgi:hypothetical protein